MKVLRDVHVVFDMGNQKELRFNSDMKAGPSAILFIRDKPETRGFRSGMKRLLKLQENNLWFLAGQAVLIAAVIIGWRIVSEPGSSATVFQTPDVAKTDQSEAANRRVIEAQEKQVADLNERVAIRTDSINYRESPPIVNVEQGPTAPIARKQTARAVPGQIIETPPPPATVEKAGNANLAQPSNPHTNSTAEAQSGVGNVVPTVANTVAFSTDHVPVTKKRPAGSVGTGGPWVINLVSLIRKADADRFEEKARSMDIKTEQQLVTIKGHKYWRVQITGFATAKEARTYAGNARDKLGLKDVWITRH